MENDVERDLDFKAKVVSSGRITIPSYIREYLDIEEGDIIEAEIKKLLKKSHSLHAGEAVAQEISVAGGEG